MKLLHTSDWHLGAADGERSLREDQEFFIDAICRVIREQAVDAVLIAGDVYDHSNAAAEAISLYDRAVTRICRDLKVPVLVIAGNHDSAERLAACSELLREGGLYVAGLPAAEPEPVALGDAEIFLLPWLTEEKAKSLYPAQKEAIDTLEDAYRLVTDHMRERFTPGRRHILLAHAYITGTETSTSDRAAEIGHATQVPASVFEGFDYVALGHIHKPQSVTATVRYSGTPMPFSFGKEEKQEKSVTLVDTASMEQTIMPLPLMHRRATLTGTLAELMEPDCGDDVRNGYVRLQVTDSYVGLETLRELKKIYPCLLQADGITFESENGGVSMTPEEFERLESDPMEVFRRFCREEMDREPDEHTLELFARAIEQAGKEDDR